MPQNLPGNLVTVKHYRLHPNSADIDSASIRYQFYDPELFDEYEREDEDTGKSNTFVRMGEKYEVINDPRKNKKSTGESAEDKKAREEHEAAEQKRRDAEKEQADIAKKAADDQKAKEKQAEKDAKEAKKLADQQEKEAEKQRKADEKKADQVKKDLEKEKGGGTSGIDTTDL